LAQVDGPSESGLSIVAPRVRIVWVVAPMPRVQSAPMVQVVCAFAFVLSALNGVRGDDYIIQKDLDVAQEADAKVNFYCDSGFRGDLDRVAARQSLVDGVGGSNVVLDILKKAQSTDDISVVAEDEITPTWIFWTVVPILMFAVLLIVYGICCWTACPLRFCCKCCRCCAKVRETRKVLKIIAVVLLFAQVMGIIVAGSLAFNGYSKAKDGFSNMACTTTKLLNSTLSGQASPAFMGFLPMLTKFEEMDDQFNDNSAFLTEIQVTLDSTAEISEAVTVASSTLSVLRDMMQLTGNVRPTYLGSDLMHECQFCQQLASGALQPAITALDTGIGSALASARGEIDKQLTPAKRQELQKTLKDGAAPLTNLKNTVRTTFKPILDYDDYSDYVEGAAFLGVCLGMIILALLLSVCGSTSMSCFVMREKYPAAVAKGQNPYNAWVYRLSCCTWCCGFCYAMLAFLVGGIMLALVVPLASSCLILDDVDGAMLGEIAPAMELNLTGDNGVMIVNMVDTCFNPPDPYGPSNMLDLLFTRNENGTKETMREQIVNKTRDSIQSKFDDIDVKLSTMNATLQDSAPILSLRSVISGNNVSSMMIAMSSLMQADSVLKDLSKDSRGASGISVGLGASASCTDHTVTSGMGTLSGTPIKGVDSFVSALTHFGPAVGYTTCAEKSDCSSTANANEASACAAGNRYIEIKRQLMEQALFRCDLFKMPGSTATCDPGNMGLSASACVWTDGTLHRKEITCTLPDFVTYVSGFDQRIDRVLSNLDTSVVAVKSKINVDMQATVRTYMLQPIEEIADGVTCGFLALYYQEMIDGLCYQGVSGLRDISRSYLACAIISLTMIILMYAIWRRSIDNANHWTPTDAKADTEAQINAPSAQWSTQAEEPAEEVGI